MMQTKPTDAAGSTASSVTAFIKAEHRGRTGIHWERLARGVHERTFHALSAEISTVQLSGPDVGIYRSEDIELLIMGQARFRGEQNWWNLKDPESLQPIAERWRARSTSALDDLCGGFLLIVADHGRKETVAAIDRIGIQGLYYAQTRDGDLLLSTHAALLAGSPMARWRISRQAIYDYCHFHMVPSPTSVYEGVSKLEPAQFLRIAAGSMRAEQYWQPIFATSEPAEQFGQLRNGLLERLAASVRRSMLSGSTASFLSGGIDSSTVTGLLVRESGHPASAYCMAFDTRHYDESHYARVSARHFGAALRQFEVTPRDVQDCLMEVAAACDEPFGNSSIIPTLICARLAKSEGVDRLLAGDGGDELFGGNTRYAEQKVFELYHRVPSRLRMALIEPTLLGWELPSRIPVVSKLVSYVRQARMPMPDRTERYNFLVRDSLESIFESTFLEAVDTGHPFELLRARYAAAPTGALVDKMLYLDWKFTLADNDLRKVGTACELAGVEVRYPWLDDEIIEFSAALGPEWKVKGQTLRYFAKQALSGFLPDEVIGKSKHGFGLPFGEWLKTSRQLQEQIYSLLEQHKRRGIMRPSFIDELIAHHRVGHAAYYGTTVWVVAMLEAWLQTHALEL